MNLTCLKVALSVSVIEVKPDKYSNDDDGENHDDDDSGFLGRVRCRDFFDRHGCCLSLELLVSHDEG